VAGETVTRIRETDTGAVDRYDNPITSDVETDIPGAFFAPKGVPEVTPVGRVIANEAPTVYWLKEWPDILVTDRLQVRGVEYRVDGIPSDWRDPWGTAVGGLVVTLARSA
jgi:hypothetical protein